MVVAFVPGPYQTYYVLSMYWILPTDSANNLLFPLLKMT